MKIQQLRQTWGGESHDEFKSLLHSNPSQELGMKALGESELRLLEWRGWTLSTGNFESQEKRAVGGGGVYIGLSQESSHWAKIHNPNKIRRKPDNVRLRLCGGWDHLG
jgi:hypothetical protein